MVLRLRSGELRCTTNTFALAHSIGTSLFEEPVKELSPKLMVLLADDILHVNLSIPVSVMTELGVQLTFLAIKDSLLRIRRRERSAISRTLHPQF